MAPAALGGVERLIGVRHQLGKAGRVGFGERGEGARIYLGGMAVRAGGVTGAVSAAVAWRPCSWNERAGPVWVGVCGSAADVRGGVGRAIVPPVCASDGMAIIAAPIVAAVKAEIVVARIMLELLMASRRPLCLGQCYHNDETGRT